MGRISFSYYQLPCQSFPCLFMLSWVPQSVDSICLEAAIEFVVLFETLFMHFDGLKDP